MFLADLSDPPDTASLPPCDESETADAVERVRMRLLRQRRRWLHAGDRARVDLAIARLRRLQNPQLSAYHRGGDLVLSEPFNGVAGVAQRVDKRQAAKLVGLLADGDAQSEIVDALSHYGQAALAAAAAAGVRIATVPEGQAFSTFSSAVARCAPAIDQWPSPPSGLFIVDEKRILLRARSLRMTAAHEFAHALDAVLARKRRSYFSYESEELRYYFATSTGFINEYAASSLDEYFAESMRAYVEVNDERCAWLPVTRQDLYLRDPRMFALIERLFMTGLAATERRRARRPHVPE
ncbi:MAG: hypothetical protein JO219_05470 [Candidatus Eremiobacteraeota bacterium]|nr:hypothetical protein [Candidatus Eremiobacteraeota bacterium]